MTNGLVHVLDRNLNSLWLTCGHRPAVSCMREMNHCVCPVWYRHAILTTNTLKLQLLFYFCHLLWIILSGSSTPMTRNSHSQPSGTSLMCGDIREISFWMMSLNSLGPSDAYMRQETMPLLVQIMGFRLLGSKPLFEPMLEYLIGPLGTNLSGILIEIHTFWFKKIHLKMSSGKWWIFCLGFKRCHFEFYNQHNSVSCKDIWGPFYQHGLIIIPARISYHMPSKLWDEITYPFPNFNGCTVDVFEWSSNFSSHFIMDVIIHPCYNYGVSERGPRWITVLHPRTSTSIVICVWCVCDTHM